tara:strand:+ start:85 stop:1740 length:1656 start_codon:yes stop_codon:yes gene_type:complete
LENSNKTGLEDSDTNIKESEDTIKSIYQIQSKNNIDINVELDDVLSSNNIQIVGLYDPSENDLTIDMWSNSDGNRIIELINKIKKIDLSKDSKEILKISLLTNSYYPTQNISYDKFLNLKHDWLLENSDLNLIEQYLIKNKTIDNNNKLIKFLVDEYLSKSELKKSCNLLSKLDYPMKDDYLSKFSIYCLINKNKKEEAQLFYDLKKELGFNDIFFEKKFDYLMGYNQIVDETISEKNILNFHLSHRINPNFIFEPNDKTKKEIWRYLSTSNLLTNIEKVDLDDIKKISSIEKATHEGNYTEEELFELYKRFQFSINQLLNVEQSYRRLSGAESRALLYQGILINSEIEKKLSLTKILKNSFIKEDIPNAFTNKLTSILENIDLNNVPSNYKSFYNKHIKRDEEISKVIKINNKIIHQSKLINYLKEDIDKQNAQKDLNDILKKIKKNKKYFISTKDIILLESLKSDGFEIAKKYENLYEVDASNMPSDINVLIENGETGLVLLRLVQILGQDNFEDLGSETLFFIVSALNQLNIDKLRNKILLKVLPLKV